MTESTGKSAIGTCDLVISQGSYNVYRFQYSFMNENGVETPQDLDGWSARSQIRKRVGGDVWLDMTSDDHISLEAEAHIQITIESQITEGSAWDEYAKDTQREPGYWDLELISDDGTVTRLVEGRVYISPDVTRSVL